MTSESRVCGQNKVMSGVAWIELESAEQIQALQKESESTAVIIFKHSSRCGTSHMMLGRLERSSELLSNAKMYFLDLLRHRNISALVEEIFFVRHESPQLLLIRHGQAVLHQSHFEIDPAVVQHSISKS